MLSSLGALAAAPPPPSAGSLLKELHPATPRIPADAATRLTVELPDGTQLPALMSFTVTAIRITGNSAFDTATLHALVADAEGRTLTLSEFGEVVARITDYYHSNGYPLAQAIVPAQVIRDGIADVAIIEARYGAVKLDNSSRARSPLLTSTLGPLKNGQAIQQAALDRSLLLLADIPGVHVNATFQPGSLVGTSDLLVQATQGRSLVASARVDGYGNRYTGRPRIGAAVSFIEPLRHGDVASVSALSAGSDLNFASVFYETLLNGKGTRIGGSYSTLAYDVGAPLESLDAHGTARPASVWVKQPLFRGRNFNQSVQIQYDRVQLRDRIDIVAIRNDRHIGNAAMSFVGDARDTLLAGGITTWTLDWTSGRVAFDDDFAKFADSQTARTEGKFSKWSASVLRLQGLGRSTRLQFSATGQWANENLDSAQKMTAGGPYNVRAYDVGAAAGDSGYVATMELQQDFGAPGHRSGRWQAVAFVDTAHVTVNHDAWFAGPNAITLSGAGLGVNWSGFRYWSARVYVARRVGSVSPLVAEDSDTRGWGEIGWAF